MILKNYGDRGECNFFHIYMLLVCFLVLTLICGPSTPPSPEYFRHNLVYIENSGCSII